MIFETLGDNYEKPEIKPVFSDLSVAIENALKLDILTLPYSIKLAIEKGLRAIRFAVADLAYDYFSYTSFEPTDEIIPILRQVVVCKYGGFDID